MKKIIQTLLIILAVSSVTNAQIIFQEDFEGGVVPAGWEIQSNASDGGWKVGSAGALSSSYFPIDGNGSSSIAATNDDDCNCDKSNDLFITPPIDLSGQTVAVLQFDAFYADNTYQGNQEDAKVYASLDKVNWDVLSDLPGESGWATYTLNISAYGGQDQVYFAFGYDDGGGWLYGFAIDNVVVDVPPTLDAGLVELENRPFGEENTPISLEGTIVNNGATTITSMEVEYTVNGGTPVLENLNSLIIPPFTEYSFAFSNPWIPSMAGDYTIDVEVISVNGMTDENLSNNDGSISTEIFEKVVPPNRIEEFLMASNPELTEVANAGDQLDKPTDLDFFPILARNELWVINERNENSGGSTLTINDATTDNPQFWHRVDGNAWHFMSLPTGIAFSSDNFNFATSPGVQDANHSGGTFTGPTLWSSDPEIYAQDSGGNGSHLDMLHGSPFSMGIAHEVDNVFWVYDDWNGDIVRYDFVDDHGPGNDYHGDALVRRYENLGINKDNDVPSHLILDKNTGWLYIVDNGNDRVLRLDINSGTGNSDLPLINEPLTEHSRVTGFTSEVIITSGLDRACGIEIMENRLLVSDYATGEIIIYDMDNNFVELGRIDTGSPGITGIKIGPEGNIWYTNRILNTLTMAEPGEPSSAEEELLKATVKVSPNPTSGSLTISLPDFAGEADLTLNDLTGKVCLSQKGVVGTPTLELGDLPNGMYLLNIRTNSGSITQKVVLEK